MNAGRRSISGKHEATVYAYARVFGESQSAAFFALPVERVREITRLWDMRYQASTRRVVRSLKAMCACYHEKGQCAACVARRYLKGE